MLTRKVFHAHVSVWSCFLLARLQMLLQETYLICLVGLRQTTQFAKAQFDYVNAVLVGYKANWPDSEEGGAHDVIL